MKSDVLARCVVTTTDWSSEIGMIFGRLFWEKIFVANELSHNFLPFSARLARRVDLLVFAITSSS